MKLLIITPFVPYPLTDGGRVSQFAFIDYQRKLIDITLYLSINTPNDQNAIEELKVRWPDVKIETIVSGLIQQVDLSIIQKFKQKTKTVLGYISTLGKPLNDFSNGVETDFDNWYMQEGLKYKNRAFIEKLHEILTNTTFDIVQVELYEFMDLVHIIPPHIKKIFVHHEVRYLRLQSNFGSTLPNSIATYPFESYLYKNVKAFETSLLKYYDAVFVFSEDDKTALANSISEIPIYVSPFPVLKDNFVDVDFENYSINKLVFLGGWEHYPNLEAVNWYKNEIAKEIFSVKKLPLKIIGSWSESSISYFSPNPYLEFVGYIDDLVDYCKNSVMLAPIRIGSGIRTKILYAMAQGIPVISTKKGCEGIGAQNKEHILIAETAKEFKEALEYLISNPDECKKITRNAQKLVADNYNQLTTVMIRNNHYNHLLNK